ncbi:MAG: glycosyl transferase [Deltaproteobacteria bacterium]|nr:glycosyl transferase [Deltaproteobacteria bacterium]
MGDFFQNGEVTNLHLFSRNNVEKLERELLEFSRVRPLALVLPLLFSDLKSEAFLKILAELSHIQYINEIVITLGMANKKEFLEAKSILSPLGKNAVIIWNSGDNIQSLYHLLNKENIPTGGDGKGRAAWMAYGYVLANGKSYSITLHDGDILTYTREFLARLCYPVSNPNLDYQFCKGYYPRIGDNKLHGRATRLFVTPLIRALKKIIGYHEFLEYLDSFRYILAGEFSMVADLARINRIPSDWGLEIGVLSEVFRNISIRRICQVELCDAYDHKHQPLSPDDPEEGLLKMTIDIAKTLFRSLSSMGVVFSEGIFKALVSTYIRIAQDFIAKYHADAIIDGLNFDRHQEALAVETFVKAIRIASEDFLKDPLGSPFIPNWNRVTSALPYFFDSLLKAVKEDNKDL